MKATQNRNIAISDLFRAIAGDEQAKFDLIACTVYSAAYSIMQAGNKTQFAKLASDAALYGADTAESSKAVKDLFGVKSINAQVKHFKRTYAAIHATLAAFPAPELVRDLPKDKAAQHAILDPLASDYADQFTANFTTLMLTPARTEEEAAQAKAARDEAKAKKAKEQARKEKQEREAFADAMRAEGARMLGHDDIGIMAADALKTGMLSPDVVQMLRIALSMHDEAAPADVIDVQAREVVQPALTA